MIRRIGALIFLFCSFALTQSKPTPSERWLAARQKAIDAVAQHNQNAESLLKQALQIAREESATGTHTARSSCDLARFYSTANKLREADKLVRRALEMWERVGVTREPHFTECLNLLADVQESMGHHEEAAALRSAVPIHFKIEGLVRDGSYESPNANLKVEIPDLFTPGARVQDGVESGGAFYVAFSDDFGRTFKVYLPPNKLTDDQFRALVDRQKDSPRTAREKKILTTSRGREFRYIEFVKGGSPLVTQRFEPGKSEPVTEPVDILLAVAMFKTGTQVVLVEVGISQLPIGNPRNEAEDNKSVTEDLDSFIEGVAVNPTVPNTAPN